MGEEKRLLARYRKQAEWIREKLLEHMRFLPSMIENGEKTCVNSLLTGRHGQNIHTNGHNRTNRLPSEGKLTAEFRLFLMFEITVGLLKCSRDFPMLSFLITCNTNISRCLNVEYS